MREDNVCRERKKKEDYSNCNKSLTVVTQRNTPRCFWIVLAARHVAASLRVIILSWIAAFNGAAERRRKNMRCTIYAEVKFMS